MVLIETKGWLGTLLKCQALVILCLSFIGLLSCSDGGTKSFAGSSGTSGSGTGWKITVQVGTSQLKEGNTTIVMATVKDPTGAPAPKGTNVCMTAVVNAFIQGSELFATICGPTQNDLGLFSQTYAAAIATGTDTIQVSSQGVVEFATINVI